MRGVYSNFQVLFFGLIGLIMVGGHNFGAESYEILDSATSGATPVETVEMPRSPQSDKITTSLAQTPATKAKITAQQATKAQKSTSVAKSSATVVKTVNTVNQPQIVSTPDNISIGGRTIRIKSVADTTVNAGSLVARYTKDGSNLLYGHNSGAVFGHLARLQAGTTFTVTLGNQPATYQIAKVVTIQKPTTTMMYTIAQGKFYGNTYNLTLMTCAGAPLPGQDATHRTIIFANRV